MSERKHKWIPGLAVAACVACCAIPLGGIFLAGAGSAAFASFFASDQFKEILICGIPLLLIISLYFFFTRRKKAAAECCATPNTTCSSNQCGVDTNKS